MLCIHIGDLTQNMADINVLGTFSVTADKNVIVVKMLDYQDFKVILINLDLCINLSSMQGTGGQLE